MGSDVEVFMGIKVEGEMLLAEGGVGLSPYAKIPTSKMWLFLRK